jgi:hypothetical protein
MKPAHLLYLAWHTGMLLLIGFMYLQDTHTTHSEKWCLSLLGIIFIGGLVDYYLECAKDKQAIRNYVLYTVILIEFWVFLLLVLYMFSADCTLDSPPG